MTRFIVPLVLLAGLVSGCDSHGCTLDLRTGLHVLFDGSDPDDSVSAVAVSEDYSEDLRCGHDGTAYTCSGLSERPGTYVVTATLNGVSEEQEITLAFDGCHVVQQTVTFFED